MSAELAVDIVYEGVVAQLTADGNTAAVIFGPRALAQTRATQGPGQANRVVFVPGDEKGALGEYGPATHSRKPLGVITPRTIYTLGELVRVYVWACDTTVPDGDPAYERAQYRAARFLHDQVCRALYLTAHGSFTLSKPSLVVNQIERKFGCELMITLTLISKIPDDPGPVADLDFAVVKPTTGVGPTSLVKVEPGTEDGSDTTHGH